MELRSVVYIYGHKLPLHQSKHKRYFLSYRDVFHSAQWASFCNHIPERHSHLLVICIHSSNSLLWFTVEINRFKKESRNSCISCIYEILKDPSWSKWLPVKKRSGVRLATSQKVQTAYLLAVEKLDVRETGSRGNENRK